MSYRLVGPDGLTYDSPSMGALGGNRRVRVYGRLDCSAAAAAAVRGPHYAEHRVFFASEEDARAAGYRPCGRCLRTEYATWKAAAASVGAAAAAR